MANTLAVCLLLVTFCCTNLSFARQLPKECSAGPTYWCQSIRKAVDCGAVGHCTATVWETQSVEINTNELSDKFIKLFWELKDVKDLINEEYLAIRIKSACSDVHYPAVTKICRENSAHLETHISHVLASKVSAETMCRIVGMCNNMKLDNIVALNKKKSTHTNKHKDTLLGASRCTWGPSYWCSNFSTGRECLATHHCVERVWSKMQVPEDNDSICKICTDMVKQARDQLESNQTQEELKEVFEGSCKLIPVKVVRGECIKMADEFVPELVETLASQMNPQVVCSVAGLCNSARLDRMLHRYHEQLSARQDCNNCQRTVTFARKKFDETSYEDFLVSLLQVCRNMGSLSDSCSMLVFKYYENIVAALKKDLEPKGVCHLSGQCVFKFHSHDEFIFPEQTVTVLQANDDLPCEFCEQVITHLRDVLIANTTETQFFRVLKGICKQTGNFKDECLHLVEEYYPMIYSYLVSDLKPKELCAMGGICPTDAKTIHVPIAPLVPKELVVKAITQSSELIGTDEANAAKPGPLPVERMFVALPRARAACSFCEYFLHYAQVELSDAATEEKIRDVVDKACDRLPQSVSGECKQFVSDYGPAVISLLVQEIDPASVCPALGLCPQTQEVRRVSINSDKSNCPLCLFAVMQLEAVLKNNRTESSIRAALDGLCNHLSAKLRTECLDFVDAYTEQLVEMLVANMNAQEICVYLKLCKEEESVRPMGVSQAADKYQLMADRNNRKKPMLPAEMLEKTASGDIETNEIPDNTRNGQPIKVTQNTVCVMCEFVMKEIDDQIKDKHNEDEIKNIVHSVCKYMPKSVRSDCDKFVERYADLVISMLAQELDPAEVCKELKLCDNTSRMEQAKAEILDCAVCETVVMAVKKVLSNDKIDHNIVHVVEKACGLLPAKYNDRCHTLMEIYGDSVIHLIEEVGTKGVCQKIGLCTPGAGSYVQMYREKKLH